MISGDITEEFYEKAIQFHGTIHGLKTTNWYGKGAFISMATKTI